MANTINTTSFISKMTGEFIEQSCPVVQTSYRGNNQYNAPQGYTSGYTFNVKVPGNPDVNTGLNLTVQDIEDKVIPVTVDPSKDLANVTYNLNAVESLLNVYNGKAALTKQSKKNIVDNYAYPTAVSLSSFVENRAIDELSGNGYLTPIDELSKLTKASSFSDVSQAKSFMDILGFPMSSRFAMLNANDYRLIADSLQNAFNSPLNDNISRNLKIKTSNGGQLSDFGVYSAPLIPIHTVGEQYAINPKFAVESISADGTQITFKTVGTVSTRLFKKGDMIWIPSVKLLRRTYHSVTEYGLTVTVAADAVGQGAAGKCTVTISDPLKVTGMHANVSALPAVDAAAELMPSHRKNFFYTMSGLILCSLATDDIIGAENGSYTSDYGLIVKTCVQGAINATSNTINTSTLNAIRAFPTYIAVVPTLV